MKLLKNIKELMSDNNVIELLNDVDAQPLALIDLYQYLDNTYRGEVYANGDILNKFTATLLECYPDILKNIPAIPDYMFSLYKGKDLEIPSNIKEIGTSSFAMAFFVNIKIPKNITNFGFEAFFDFGFNNLIYEGTFNQLRNLIIMGQNQRNAFDEMIQERDVFKGVWCLGDKNTAQHNYLKEFIKVLEDYC